MSNIQVVVRCRGRTERESNAKSPVVVELPNDNFSVVDPYITINNDKRSVVDSKTYKVDQVYGSQADQGVIFENVALPLFNDFMEGFNVTILAYGQTGTGKTYTMCGDERVKKIKEQSVADGRNYIMNSSPAINSEFFSSSYSESSGIIPRVLVELFNRLEDPKYDYVVKCSFLELYNEELSDMLDDKGKLRMYETNKNTVVQNLTEEYILNSIEGLRLLDRGLNKRKTASTKLNDFSSRSHTIFTINLYKKVEAGPNGLGTKSSIHSKPDSLGSSSYKSGSLRSSSPKPGSFLGHSRPSRAPRTHLMAPLGPLGALSEASSVEESGELFKISKINLVDLAGSENITKSGAQNQRAKEAGIINQSLLTLGRVINCLSEGITKESHIPYRESKLTRLLKDSIGGNTKTSLIATISPAKINIEETISTLDYASKVKNIKNSPQSYENSNMIMKKILVKNLSHEIVKLNNDLKSTRSKNGIYLNEENYRQIIDENDGVKLDLKEAKMKNETMDKEILKMKILNLTLNDENLKIKTSNFKLNDEVISLKLSNSTLNDEVSSLKSSNMTLNTEIESLKSSNAAKESSISSLNEAVLGIKSSNSALNERILALNSSNASKDSVIASLNGDISSLKSSLSSKDAAISSLNATLSSNSSIITTLNNKITIKDSKIASLEAKCSAITNNLHSLQKMNDDLSHFITKDHLQNSNDDKLSNMNKNLAKDLARLTSSVKSYQTLFESSLNEIELEKTKIVNKHNEWKLKSNSLFQEEVGEENDLDENEANYPENKHKSSIKTVDKQPQNSLVQFDHPKHLMDSSLNSLASKRNREFDIKSSSKIPILCEENKENEGERKRRRMKTSVDILQYYTS